MYLSRRGRSGYGIGCHLTVGAVVLEIKLVVVSLRRSVVILSIYIDDGNATVCIA